MCLYELLTNQNHFVYFSLFFTIAMQEMLQHAKREELKNKDTVQKVDAFKRRVTRPDNNWQEEQEDEVEKKEKERQEQEAKRIAEEKRKAQQVEREKLEAFIPIDPSQSGIGATTTKILNLTLPRPLSISDLLFQELSKKHSVKLNIDLDSNSPKTNVSSASLGKIIVGSNNNNNNHQTFGDGLKLLGLSSSAYSTARSAQVCSLEEYWKRDEEQQHQQQIV